MPPEEPSVRYATGEVARIGDRVNNDGWSSVVEDVIVTPERQSFWGVSEAGLMLKCVEAGLVFEPCSSSSWDAILFESRAE
jgi:hypothetical protein